MLKRSKSDFLFAQPSFLSGAARVLDLGATFDRYNETENPDTLALTSDWFAIGDDLYGTLETMGVPETIAGR